MPPDPVRDEQAELCPSCFASSNALAEGRCASCGAALDRGKCVGCNRDRHGAAFGDSFVCTSCIARALHRHATSRWRDAVLAFVAAALLLLLPDRLRYLAMLAAAICLALAVRASWIVAYPGSNREAARDVVRRLHRTHQPRLEGLRR